MFWKVPPKPAVGALGPESTFSVVVLPDAISMIAMS
jgi:hypothetical protein